MQKIIFYFLVSFSLLYPINNNIYDIANYLDKKSLSISGEFYSYDFSGVPAHWDYVFKSTNGTILQLRGNSSTPSDLFGWKKINITLSLVPDYYFVYLGDFDFDGDNRFDWLLIQQSKQIAYKLQGSSLDSTFVWSTKIPVSFYVNNNQVIFTKNQNIPTNTTSVSNPASQVPSVAPIATPSQPTSSGTPIPQIPIPSTNLEKPPIPPL